MTDHDRAAARREIADALVKALDRRHEALDVIVDAANRTEAVDAIAGLLGVSHLGAEAVMGMGFHQLTKDSRIKIADELEDLNKQLTFTLVERPESSGETLTLREFAARTDRDIFAARTEDVHSAADGSGTPAGSLDDEISSGESRIYQEDAAWLVALAGTEKVGMVFGELNHGEVSVRVWIHPDHRKKGYGTAALRKARTEMAGYFPGCTLVVRTPGVDPA